MKLFVQKRKANPPKRKVQILKHERG